MLARISSFKSVTSVVASSSKKTAVAKASAKGTKTAFEITECFLRPVVSADPFREFYGVIHVRGDSLQGFATQVHHPVSLVCPGYD